MRSRVRAGSMRAYAVCVRFHQEFQVGATQGVLQVQATAEVCGKSMQSHGRRDFVCPESKPGPTRTARAQGLHIRGGSLYELQ